MRSKKILLAAIVFSFFGADLVRADVILPPVGPKECPKGETQVFCLQIITPDYSDSRDCRQYQNDPEYYFLQDLGPDFEKIYCKRAAGPLNEENNTSSEKDVSSSSEAGTVSFLEGDLAVSLEEEAGKLPENVSAGSLNPESDINASSGTDVQSPDGVDPYGKFLTIESLDWILTVSLPIMSILILIMIRKKNAAK